MITKRVPCKGLLHMFSGMSFHIVGTVLFIALTCSWFTWYAVRIRKDPTKSVMYEADKNRDVTQKVDMRESSQKWAERYR